MTDHISVVLRDPSIVKLIVGRLPKHSLLALCATCKEIHKQALPYLYRNLTVSTPASAFVAALTVQKNPGLGSHVRSFKTYATRRGPLYPDCETKKLWQCLSSALRTMKNLETLQVDDLTSSVFHQQDSFTWVMHGALDITTLRHFLWSFQWDAELDVFLEQQHSLRSLFALMTVQNYSPLATHENPEPCPWPELERAEVALPLARRLCGAPLKTLVAHIQTDKATEDFLTIITHIIPRLQGSKTLKALAFRNLHRHIVTDIISAVATAFPNLRYFGSIALSPHYRSDVHAALMGFHALEVLELEGMRFDPCPTLAAQRALAFEFQTYCPTLCVLVLWLGDFHRSVLRFDDRHMTWAVDTDAQRRNTPGWDLPGRNLGSEGA